MRIYAILLRSYVFETHRCKKCFNIAIPLTYSFLLEPKISFLLCGLFSKPLNQKLLLFSNRSCEDFVRGPKSFYAIIETAISYRIVRIFFSNFADFSLLFHLKSPFQPGFDNDFTSKWI